MRVGLPSRPQHQHQTHGNSSDVHYWQRGRIGDFVLDSPIVLGHESAGTVVSVGPAVKNLRPGDRVAIEPGVPCRHCDYCRSGSYNLCADTVFAATPPHNGTLSRYFKTAGDYCYKIPDHMTLEDGALCEPVACAVQINRVGEVRGGQVVVVFGCGPIGLLVQSVAKVYGARTVICVDINEARMAMATDDLACADGVFAPPPMPEGYGAGEAEDAADRQMLWSAQVARQIKDNFDLGEGPDVVIDATGSQSAIQTGLQLCRKGGMYVQAGMGREVSRAVSRSSWSMTSNCCVCQNIVFPITTACIRDLTIRGSIRYVAGVYPSAVDLVASGKVKPQKLVSHRYKFEQAVEAFETVRKGGPGVLKVIIEGVQGN